MSIYGITESADGKIFISGSYGSRCLIMKLDNTATLEWAKYYNFVSGFVSYSIAKAATGNGVVITGSAY